MPAYRTLFFTDRGAQHQEWARQGAPAELDMVIRRAPTRDEILGLLPDADFLISERSGVIDAEMIAAGRKLRLIQRLGVQSWDIDLEAARAAGIPVCVLPIQTCALVAEHIVLQILGLIKRLRELMALSEAAADGGIAPRRCDEDHFAYNWTGRENITSLAGKSVGILGFGEIGVELARRLSGFDCQVLYQKRKRLPARAETELGLTYVSSRDELAAQSDVVVALLPLGPETDQCLNTAFFEHMRPGSLFVQTGGSGTVDEGALGEALRSAHLGGAAVDGYTWEPVPPDNVLIELARDPQRNLILTPHVAAGAVPGNGALRAGDYLNIVALLAGQALRYRLV
jgi:lactate dehydrogenase-like 2-hydroxyacid dehydrogenase